MSVRQNSAVVAVRQRLVALLQARPVLAQVDVRYAWAEDLALESIVMGDARGTNEYPVMTAGRKRRDERLTVNVICTVEMPGADQVTADLRAQVLAGAVEDVIADDPTLGLDGVTQVGVETYDTTAALGDDSRIAQVVLGVSYRARLV